ncbi:chloroplast outer envelope translocon protein [Klebsormidium nitens]|uniref:Chloroplast outer envelope translocon protein n=1 Tax=Klebsormidium nitens TaxID=105231 RepID=A0A1Y1IQ94_KLENI|nr:chloroplast outer envelope translocon protein [Klebsormidium nitens]|eukprot:GAQ90308.1 chloroplast outer envelope translocon protein [Klebsormidium nitens]
MGSRGPSLPGAPRMQIPEWRGLAQFPVATQQALHNLLEKLRQKDKDSLNILVLGKGAVGKSSTVNSIVGERVVTVTPFQGEIVRPEVVFRQKAGFTLSIFDTPAIDDGSVNEDLLKGMRGFLLEKPIDALLYVDRLDTYRVDDLDREAMAGITKVFGARLWKDAVLVLTHGQCNPPEGTTISEYVARRTANVVAAIKQAAKKGGVTLNDVPVAIVENSSRCNTNSGGEKILYDNSVWLPALVGKIVDVALRPDKAGPYMVTEDMVLPIDGNSRLRWLIAPLLALQVGLVYRFFAKRLHQEQTGLRPEDRFRLLTHKDVERWKQTFKRAALEADDDDEDED